MSDPTHPTDCPAHWDEACVCSVSRLDRLEKLHQLVIKHRDAARNGMIAQTMYRIEADIDRLLEELARG